MPVPRTPPLLPLAWVAVAGLLACDVAWCLRLGFTVPVAPCLSLAGSAAVLGLLYGLYRFLRPEPVLAEIAHAGLFLVAATLALATANYLGFTLRRPLQDDAFAAFDRTLGFDFLRHMAFLVEHPLPAKILNACYMTSFPQVVLTVPVLAFTGRARRLRDFLVLFAMTAGAVVLASALWPSLGAYSYHGLPDLLLPAFADPRAGWEQVPHITALRDGSMRQIPLDDMRGLVSFPSFHTALAIVTTWALLDVPILGLVAVGVNALLILATPSNGNHYLADVAGGGAIALAALFVVTGYRALAVRRRRAGPLPA